MDLLMKMDSLYNLFNGLFINRQLDLMLRHQNYHRNLISLEQK